MNTRQAHQIRAGIEAARLANACPRLRDGLYSYLSPLGRNAFERWEKDEPLRYTRRMVRLVHQEARKRVEEFRIARQFAAIIEYNRETNA